MKRDKIASMTPRRTGAFGAQRSFVAALTLAACAACAPASSGQSSALVQASLPAQAVPVPAEHVLTWKALRNGDFEERGGASSPPQIPWWRSSHGSAQLEAAQIEAAPIETTQHGGLALRTGPGERAEQPIAAYAPLVDQMRVHGRVRGEGVLTFLDGHGVAATVPMNSKGDTPYEFSLTGVELRELSGRPLMPRFTLRLAGAKDKTALWDDIGVEIALPLPDEAQLRTEVIAQLDAIFATWAERALDVAGPRKTAFVARSFDVVTGAELGPVDPAYAFFPLQENLLDAWVVHDEPRWRALLERYLEDVLSLALHPETGLPCLWNAATDVRVDDRPVEIALPLGFLIDVARKGPEAFRARARDAAVKIGETVLARGLLPDGEIAASYVPRTGDVNLNISRLRRLDVAAQLARLADLTGEERFAKPAREALAVLEYSHHWGGSWNEIDPAFDDSFGHYGARAATVALARPNDAFFRRFAVEGIRHFIPLWQDATRFGGNVAADQVRCWRIAADLARVDPTLRAQLEPVLFDAVHAHVQGEQYGNGAWGDVTIFDFAPKIGLEVGDMPGTPQNLLNGLSAAYTSDLGLRTPLTRALFTAVLRSTVNEYGRPHGFLLGRVESARGGNNAAGSLRVLLGLTTMLRGLDAGAAPR